MDEDVVIMPTRLGRSQPTTQGYFEYLTRDARAQKPGIPLHADLLSSLPGRDGYHRPPPRARTAGEYERYIRAR
jgi:hypothetical protein